MSVSFYASLLYVTGICLNSSWVFPVASATPPFFRFGLSAQLQKASQTRKLDFPSYVQTRTYVALNEACLLRYEPLLNTDHVAMAVLMSVSQQLRFDRLEPLTFMFPFFSNFFLGRTLSLNNGCCPSLRRQCYVFRKQRLSYDLSNEFEPRNVTMIQ